MDTSIWRPILYLVGFMAFAGLNAAYLGWCERKGAGRIQRRTGPMEVGFQGLLQPLADGLKLMSKQLLVPQGVDGIFINITNITRTVKNILTGSMKDNPKSIPDNIGFFFRYASFKFMNISKPKGLSDADNMFFWIKNTAADER